MIIAYEYLTRETIEKIERKIIRAMEEEGGKIDLKRICKEGYPPVMLHIIGKMVKRRKNLKITFAEVTVFGKKK